MPWRENNLPVTNSPHLPLKTHNPLYPRENKKNFCLVGFDRLSLTMVELQI